MKGRSVVRMKAITVGVATATLLLAGCSTTSNGAGGNAGGGAGAAKSLTVAIGTVVDSLDPAAQVTTAVMQQVSMMVETLTTVDASGTPKGLLATSWKVSGDGLSYTFTLRQGVKFSDGTPFNAAAVKWSLDRINNPDTFKANPNVFSVIASVDAPDTSTAVIHLKNPFPALPAALSLPIAGITSPTAGQKAPNTAQQIKKPVGTGPYVFDEMVAGDHLTMDRNPNYWGAKPTYDRQTYKVVPDASSRIALLKSGGAQVISDPPVSELQALQNDKTAKVETFDSPYVIQMQFNLEDTVVPQMKKVEVRQALSYAVDRDTIIKSVLFGAGSTLTGPLPNFVNGSCSTDVYTYNVQKAKQMLAAAGVSGLKVKMMSPNGRYLNDYKVAQAVAGYLRAVGVQVDLAAPTDFATYLTSVNVAPKDSTNRSMHLIGWGALYPDASQALFQFNSKDLPPKGYDGSYYNNPAYDKLVNAGDQTVNDSQRANLYCQAQKQLVADAPVMWLYGLKNVLVTSGVSGVEGRPTNQFNTVYAVPAS